MDKVAEGHNKKATRKPSERPGIAGHLKSEDERLPQGSWPNTDVCELLRQNMPFIFRTRTNSKRDCNSGFWNLTKKKIYKHYSHSAEWLLYYKARNRRSRLSSSERNLHHDRHGRPYRPSLRRPRHTRCPAVLIENFFMDNKQDLI